MVIVLVAEVPVTAPKVTCSLYGPLPAATLITIGPVIPQLTAAAASEKLWKFPLPVGRASLIVNVPPERTLFTRTGKLDEVDVDAPQVTTAWY